MNQVDKYYLKRWKSIDDWTKINKSKAFRYKNFKKLLSKFILGKSRKNILDYGCGSAWQLNMLFKDGYTNLYGYDITPSTLELAKEKFPFIKKFYCPIGPFENDIPEEFFDVCTSIEVFEHISYSDKHSFLKAIHKCLKPNGYVYLTTPNSVYKKYAIDPQKFQPVEDWVTSKELEHYLAEAGFKVLDKNSFHFNANYSFIHQIFYADIMKIFFRKINIKDKVDKIFGKQMLGLSMLYFCQKIEV